MTRRFLPVLLLTIILLPIRADTEQKAWLSDLSDTVRGGVLANLDYAAATRDLSRALANRRGDPAIEDSQLKLSATHSFGEPTPNGLTGDTSDTVGKVDLSVPVLDWLSVSASATTGDEITGSVGLTLTPLVGDAERRQAEETYRRAALSEQDTLLQVIYEVEESLLDSSLRALRVENARQSVSVEQQVVEIARKQYELGEITYLGLNEAESDLDVARNTLSQAMRDDLSGRQELLSLFALREELPAIPEINDSVLSALVTAKLEVVEPLLVGREQLRSKTLDDERVDLWKLEAELADTPMIRPTLSLGASTDFELKSHEVELALILSPNQWAREDRTELKEDIIDARVRIAAELRALELERALSVELLEIAKRELEVARVDLERSQLELDEITVLLQLGRSTTVERDQAELTRDNRELDVLESLLAVNNAANDALILYNRLWHADG